jgi:hypothetical protein
MYSGLGMEKVGIFCGHLGPFCIFCGQLEYFSHFWSADTYKKNKATLVSTGLGIQTQLFSDGIDDLRFFRKVNNLTKSSIGADLKCIEKRYN